MLGHQWRTGFAVLALVGVSTWARHGAAQAAPTSSEAEAGGKDLVQLKNGGMLRGTISELIPNGTVTIVTVTGKVREVSMSEVAYAGPAAQAPQAEPAPPAPAETTPVPAAPAPAPTPGAAEGEKVQPYVTVKGQRATLHLESVPPGITFHRASSSAVAVGAGGVAVATAYDRLCTAPCTVTIPAGTEVLALSQPGGRAREAGPVTFSGGETRIIGRFESRSGVRVAGWMIAAASAVGGFLVMRSALDKKEECFGSNTRCYEKTELSTGTFAAGLGIIAVGIPVGVVMGLIPDRARVEVGGRAAAAPSARGLLLSGTF